MRTQSASAAALSAASDLASMTRLDHFSGPASGTPVEVSVRNGAWSWSPASAVVVAARTADCGPGGGSFEVMCPHTAFHVSGSSAQAWLAGRDGLDAEILDQQTAIECGRLNFGSLLAGSA